MQPLSYYGSAEGIHFYLVDCGCGLTHLIIFPDETVMLFDCNLQENNEKESNSKDEILSLFSKVIPKKMDENGNEFHPIDIFVNSYRDNDHIRGLKFVNEKFPIQTIWDSGFHGDNTDNADYQYYMRLRRSLKNKSAGSLVVPIPEADAFRTYGGADIYCLCDSEDFQKTSVNESQDKPQHTNCIVLLICYAGRKMLLTGDSGWQAWREKIVPNFKDEDVNYQDTDILIASHHGSKSFFTEKDPFEQKDIDEAYIEHIQAITPKITLISCASEDYGGYHLPNKTAISIYKKYTDNEQVYTTYDEGTICGLISSTGNFLCVPLKFHVIPSKNKDCKVSLTCKAQYNNSNESVTVLNESTLEVGCRLTFSLYCEGGALDGNPVIIWEVCNSGIAGDSCHHEIYYKGKDEQSKNNIFERDLMYVGRHLLRYCAINKKKSLLQQGIFVVDGVYRK